MPPKVRKTASSGDIGFSVVIGGQIESADFGGIDNLYCKYSFCMELYITRTRLFI